MANVTEEKKAVETQLEMAAKPVPFTEGEYFRGMCEIAAAAHKKINLFIPANTKGIFDSLFHKRIFARAIQADGSYSVGNFNISENRYLYVYDRRTGTYMEKKEDNYDAFLQLTKEICDKNDFKVFSTTKPVSKTELDELLG